MPFAEMNASQLFGYLFSLIPTVLIELACLVTFTPLARFAERIIGFLTTPLRKPVEILQERLTPPTGALAAFGGWPGIAYLACATVFSCAVVHHSLNHGTTPLKLHTELLYNTTFGAFVGLLQSNLSSNFSAVTLVSIGASAFLAGFLSSSLDDAKWYVRLPGHLISLVAYAMLARYLTAPLQAIADWGYTTLVSLFHWQFTAFLPALGNILLLILLGYIALLLILMTLHEYFIIIACIFPAFVVAVPVQIIMSNITHPAVQTFWQTKGDMLTVAVCVIAAELIQPYVEDIHSFICNRIPFLQKLALKED